MSSRTGTKWTVSIVLGLAVGPAVRAAPVGSEFTYQGRLKRDGVPITDTCDFAFSLWDDPTAGTQIGPTDSRAGVGVEGGLFTVVPDFGEGVFTGRALWLEVSVQCPGDATLETLVPRQKLTPSGYAHGLRHLHTEQFPVANVPGGVGWVNVIGGIAEVDPGVAGATVSGGGRIIRPFGVVQAEPNRVKANFGTIGGGLGNTVSGYTATIGGGRSNRASADGATVPGGIQNDAGGTVSFAAGRRAKVRDAAASGDVDGDEGTFVWADSTDADFTSTGPDQFLIRASGNVGINKNDPADALDVAGNIHADGLISSGNSITIDGVNDRITSPTTMELHVGGTRVLRLEPNATSPNVIVGYAGNAASPGVVGATVSGGGSPGSENRVMGDHGTISGGDRNTAGGRGAAIGGGVENTTDGYGAAVGGGVDNSASGTGASVCGGEANAASDEYATVGGGEGNTAAGAWATVPGGFSNAAVGDNSFAAGQLAKADHNGAFVWADSAGENFTSTGPNQFLIRASGGVGINTNDPADALDVAGNIHADGTISADAFSSNSPLALQTAGITRIYADDTTGNVGIGTDAPNYSLHVKTSGAANGIKIQADTGATFPQLRWTDDTDTLLAAISVGTVTPAMNLFVNGEDRVHIDSAGKVGIGTTSPSAGLHTLGGPFYQQVRFESDDIEGTWLNLDNTDTGGREFAIISTGSVNTEGAGSLLFRDNNAGAVRMMIDAGGNVGIGTTSIADGEFIATSTGAYLSNGGAWTNASDRNAKENIEPAPTGDILDRLMSVPVAEWSYKVEDDSVRHIGPMAQDFHAAFGLGDSDKAIATIDADGVALAAIQGLYRIIQEKECELNDVLARSRDVEARNQDLEARVAALERLVAQSTRTREAK